MNNTESKNQRRAQENFSVNYIPYVKKQSYKNRIYSQNKVRIIISRIIIMIIAALAISAVFIVAANKFFFKIRNIEISANDIYSLEQIVEAGGITYNEEMFSFKANKTKNDIKEKLTYINSINIVKVPPSTVKINFTVDKGVYAVKIGGDIFILSNEFMVLEKINVHDVDNYKSLIKDNIIDIKTNSIKKCFLKNKVIFRETDTPMFMSQAVAVLRQCEIINKIKEIDIKDKFDITLNYDNRYLIKFGNFNDVEKKLHSMIKIVEQLPENNMGIINISDTAVASFSYNDKLFD